MPNTDKLALIIGVDVYYANGPDGKPSMAPLPCCKRDANDLYFLLSSVEFGYTIFGNAPIIGSNLNEKYGFHEIQRAIVNFFNSASVGQTLFFYCSGHGIPRANEVYLATPQVDPNEPIPEGFRRSDLTSLMDSSKSRTIVCIIDACYSGAVNLPNPKFDPKSPQADEEVAKFAIATYDRIFKNIPQAEGRCFLLSSQAYSRSWVVKSIDDKYDNSIFTKYLIEGLRGVKPTVGYNGRNIPYSGSVDENGHVTPESLHDYVYYKVANEVRQLPVFKGVRSSRIILAKHPNLATKLNLAAPDITSIIDDADEYTSKKEYDKAIECYDKALKVRPNDALVWNDKSSALFKLGYYEDTMKCIDKAIELDPQDPLHWSNKASLLAALKKYEETEVL